MLLDLLEYAEIASQETDAKGGAMEWLETSNRRGKWCYVERSEGPSPSDGPSPPGRGQGQEATALK